MSENRNDMESPATDVRPDFPKRLIALPQIAEIRVKCNEVPYKFVCVQVGLAVGTAFLSVLKAEQKEAISAYDAKMNVIKAQRNRANVWMTALQERATFNRERRGKLSNLPKKSYVRTDKTCANRGCYAPVYRNLLCEQHFLKAQKKK